MQVSGSSFDIEMFVLSRSTFSTKQRTTMDINKVAVGESVSLFGVLRFLIVDAKMPFRVFSKSMLLDEIVFILSGGLVLNPCVSFVPHKVVFHHQPLSVIKCGLVSIDCHIFLLTCSASGRLRFPSLKVLIFRDV